MFKKVLGLFVERVPVDEQGKPMRDTPHKHSAPSKPAPTPPVPTPPQSPVVASTQQQGVSVVLKANVPQQYAAYLAPHGLHVIAGGPSITIEQAKAWNSRAIIISAECIGADLNMLQNPQLPTVFITQQPVMIPQLPGLVQVQEPLRVSDIARAVQDAVKTWDTAHPHS